MALPDFSMRQLLEAGVHFGHQAHRWNPKMERYIFGVRNDIHILDLAQTVPMLSRALQLVSDTVAEGGRVLFVGTKRQAAPVVAQAARDSAQYFVNSRWLGGTLTNWQTISRSIARLRELEAKEAEGMQGLTKKERLMLDRERARLDTDLGGIKDMGNLPSLCSSSTPTRKPTRSRKRVVSASRWWRSSTPIPIPTGSTIRSRATTTPRAPSSSTAA